jgi:hypothetical protein
MAFSPVGVNLDDSFDVLLMWVTNFAEALLFMDWTCEIVLSFTIGTWVTQ